MSDPRKRALDGDPHALAQALVSIPSVNPDLEPDGAGEEEIAAFCAELLDSWGLDVTVTDAVPGRPNLVAHLPGDGPTLLLNGHLDTVGVHGMSIDPFAADIVGGRLRGRGSCDMKGGVAALMAATHALLQHPRRRPGLIVALTADEENASVGMASLVKAGVQADLAVVCEPTELAIMPAHKGFIWMEASFRGHAAHGSRPDIGVDAIRHAALYLAALDDHARALTEAPPHPLLGYGSFHAGTIRGGHAASVYPEACTLVLERRTLPGEDHAEAVKSFRDALARLAETEPSLVADLGVVLERPGTEVPIGAPLVQGLSAALRDEGRPARIEGMTAWVDAAYLNEVGIPAVCFGPGSIEQAHTADEWVELEEITACVDVLTRFALSLAR